MKLRHKGGVQAAVLAAAAMALLFATGIAGGLTPPDPTQVVDHVTICHRTNSNNNPYVINSPAADGDVSGHADHVGDGTLTEPVPGPVWNDTLKAQHIKWGDIIPPFKWSGGDYPGLNWTAAGQAIYENDCEAPPPVEQLFGELEITKAVVNGTVPGAPASFTLHVDCDDKTRDDIVINGTGNVGNPVVISDIEAGSTCIITELNTNTFPAGSTVAFNPPTANTTGVLVDAEQTVEVTVTNTFQAPTPAAEAVTVTPAFTG
jgi:hypothetical protein